MNATLFLLLAALFAAPFTAAFGTARPSLTQFSHWGARETGEPVVATAGDWTLSLGILLAGVGLGIYLATLLWSAAGG